MTTSAMAHRPGEHARVAPSIQRVEARGATVRRLPPPRVFRDANSRALIIGVSVNDTSRLTITATAAVMPNW